MKNEEGTLVGDLEKTEEDIEKMLVLLEQFSKGVMSSKLKEKTIFALFAKHLRMSVRDFKFLIDTVKSGRLRRELFK